MMVAPNGSWTWLKEMKRRALTCLASGEAEHLSLLFTGERKLTDPFELARAQIIRLPAIEYGADNVRRQVAALGEAREVAPTPVVAGGGTHLHQLIPSTMRLHDQIDEMAVKLGRPRTKRHDHQPKLPPSH